MLFHHVGLPAAADPSIETARSFRADLPDGDARAWTDAAEAVFI
jgi:hypothetical protein